MSESGSRPRVLHVVVGHGLRTYFVNSVKSLQTTAPNDELLVIDNASPDETLRTELSQMAELDPNMQIVLRDSNDLTNGKVGGLYDAYREAFAIALGRNFDYLHLVQGDMQVLWWDDTVIFQADKLFDLDPHCVNVYTCMLSSDKAFTPEIQPSGYGKTQKLASYGLADTGIFHLGRWKQFGMSFGGSESAHGYKYLTDGFTVLCHPWPTDAPIPWPAFVRGGFRHGREIAINRPFLLRPLSPDEISNLKQRNWTWLEDVCIPWGWTCLSPMWTTHVDVDYWAARRQDAAENGLASGLPRWDRRGLETPRWRPFWLFQYRPSLWKLFVVVPFFGLISKIREHLSSGNAA
jgi:hypothetical protein